MSRRRCASMARTLPALVPGDPSGDSPPAIASCEISSKSPMCSSIAGSAPRGTVSLLTETDETVWNSLSRPSSTPRASTASDSAAPRGTSNTRIAPSTTATTKIGAGVAGSASTPLDSYSRSAREEWDRSAGEECECESSHEPQSALSAETSAPPRPREDPNATTPSSFSHVDACAGNAHGHADGTIAGMPECESPPPLEGECESTRHLSSASCPCHDSMNRAHAICSSTARSVLDAPPPPAFNLVPSSNPPAACSGSLYRQCAARPYSAASCISRVRI
mmetsp:Transcript_5454/g.19715  ORF Transcript_5454/g.19715 Transcript_5454/m.19715 type:complete len:279 (-) Transcript_5454:1856-2692(-)